eukprot:2744324-Rhodomonas_salina.1
MDHQDGRRPRAVSWTCAAHCVYQLTCFMDSRRALCVPAHAFHGIAPRIVCTRSRVSWTRAAHSVYPLTCFMDSRHALCVFDRVTDHDASGLEFSVNNTHSGAPKGLCRYKLGRDKSRGTETDT